MASVRRPLLDRWRHPRAGAQPAGPAAAHPVTIRIDAESPGPVIPYVINFYGAVPIDGGITEL